MSWSSIIVLKSHGNDEAKGGIGVRTATSRKGLEEFLFLAAL